MKVLKWYEVDTTEGMEEVRQGMLRQRRTEERREETFVTTGCDRILGIDRHDWQFGRLGNGWVLVFNQDCSMLSSEVHNVL